MSDELYAGPPEDPDRLHLLDDGTRGGEGRTWRAAYTGGLSTPLPQAVKMLFPPAGRRGRWPSEADIRRWHDNAALLRHLDQPHVVKLHDIFAGEPPHAQGAAAGADPTVAYLLMEWVDGPTLAESVRGGPVSGATLGERLRWVGQIATAVDALHSTTRSAGNPALHRDLTPTNCIVHPRRGIVVIDISGMRLVDDGFDPLGRHTPAYTAPEVLRHPNVPRQPSSDLYAVGAVALFCITGGSPGDVVALLRAAGAARPDEAARHLLRMTADDPDDRPTDVVAWARRLAELAAPRRRRWMLPAAAAAASALLAVGAGLYLTTRPDGAGATPGAARRPAVTVGPIEPVAGSKGVSEQDFSSTRGSIDPLPDGPPRDCEYFTGMARVDPGRTIVLSLHTRGEAPATMRWIQVVFGYPKPPQGEWTWRAAQYFNDGMIGKDTVVELVEVPNTQELRAAEDKTSFIAKSRIAYDKGTVLAATTVRHVNASNPKFPCPEHP